MTVSRGTALTSRELAQHQAEQAALRAADKHDVARRAKARGMGRRRILAPDGAEREVWAHASFTAMHFEKHQVAAAERFQADWEAAYNALRAQMLEPGVDGSRGMHGPQMVRLEAQHRLTRCQAYIGARTYDFVVAVAVHGATIQGISKISGRHHRVIRTNIDLAFEDLAGFYAGERRKDKTWLVVEQMILDRTAQITKAEREAR